MRIVQTFWSSYGNPTGYSYGWIKPEYNLMSWALSCLCLKKYYNKVELYTDSRGYEILIEKMGLPYSSAHIVFDDFECLPYHWAFSKIKTYSLQKEHFLHVDAHIDLRDETKSTITYKIKEEKVNKPFLYEKWPTKDEFQNKMWLKYKDSEGNTHQLYLYGKEKIIAE